ncbi:MAG: dihydroorotase [Candidatus Marinimicrobia bacterium]|nr:dihydroorotase [Candidatus Neomarinimicrobiota bacterium]
MKILIKNGLLVNENKIFESDILVNGELIEKIDKKISSDYADSVIDCEGSLILPGIIDDQVHFREPGFPNKATIYSESRAAVAGGVTSYFEMPNTDPSTTTLDRLNQKFDIASKSSLANYSFMFGGTNQNIGEIKRLTQNEIPGIKLFLGSSTGNMLVDDYDLIEELFKISKVPIVVHSEDDTIINENLEKFKKEYGEENLKPEMHAKIRSSIACLKSTKKIISLAKKTNGRLHVFHLSTKEEANLFDNQKELKNKKITSEVCIHHLSFHDGDYMKKGNLIKWNPSVKTIEDQNVLWDALVSDKIDVIATDHAPHTLNEKNRSYIDCPSGGPLVQHSLYVMYEHFLNGKISLEKIVQKMCHNPAILFNIKKRGFLREGFFADLVILKRDQNWTINENNILYKCGWSPFDGKKISSLITHTFVSGHLAYKNGTFNDNIMGKKIEFCP